MESTKARGNIQLPLDPAAGYVAEVEKPTGPHPHPFLHGKFWAMLWALNRPGISFSERAVLAALASRIDESGCCYPGLDCIAADVGGVSRQTVSKAIKGLEGKGLLAIVGSRSKGGKGRTNLYRVGGNGNQTVRRSDSLKDWLTVTSGLPNCQRK